MGDDPATGKILSPKPSEPKGSKRSSISEPYLRRQVSAGMEHARISSSSRGVEDLDPVRSTMFNVQVAQSGAVAKAEHVL